MTTNLDSVAANGGELLARQLVREGVRHVFGIPGVQTDAAVDGLWQVRDRVELVTTRNEQAATYLADGYARATGQPGVALVVPGPGVLNALSGLATAYACHSPVLLIAGQVPVTALGKGYGMLHELPDQTGILDRMTAWTGIACTPGDVAPLVREALRRLRSQPTRPVAIEVPQDVLDARAGGQGGSPAGGRAGAPTDAGTLDPLPGEPRAEPDPAAIRRAAEVLSRAQFPMIWAGGGVTASGAGEELRVLAERLQAPVVMTERALGVLPATHPLALTALGARALAPHVDAVLVVGSRFLNRRAAPPFAAPGADFVYLNVDDAAMEAPRAPGIQVHADAAHGLAALAAELDGRGQPASRAAQTSAVRQWCEAYVAMVGPQHAWAQALRAAVPEHGVVVPDLTAVGYVLPVAYPVLAPHTLVTSGYQGNLGFALPVALGMAVGDPQRPVVSLSGDGGFGMSLGELATVRKLDANLVMVVMNDNRFGNVHLVHQGRFGHSHGTELVNPDFVALAGAFGIPAARVDGPDALRTALADAVATPGPVLLEVPVGPMPSPWFLLSERFAAPGPVPPDPLGQRAEASTVAK